MSLQVGHICRLTRAVCLELRRNADNLIINVFSIGWSVFLQAFPGTVPVCLVLVTPCGKVSLRWQSGDDAIDVTVRVRHVALLRYEHVMR